MALLALDDPYGAAITVTFDEGILEAIRVIFPGTGEEWTLVLHTSEHGDEWLGRPSSFWSDRMTRDARIRRQSREASYAHS